MRRDGNVSLTAQWQAYLQPNQAVTTLNERVKRITRLNIEIADWLQVRPPIPVTGAESPSTDRGGRVDTWLTDCLGAPEGGRPICPGLEAIDAV